MPYECTLLQNTSMAKKTEALWQAIENVVWPWQLTGTRQLLDLLQGADVDASQEAD